MSDQPTAAPVGKEIRGCLPLEELAADRALLQRCIISLAWSVAAAMLLQTITQSVRVREHRNRRRSSRRRGNRVSHGGDRPGHVRRTADPHWLALRPRLGADGCMVGGAYRLHTAGGRARLDLRKRALEVDSILSLQARRSGDDVRQFASRTCGP